MVGSGIIGIFVLLMILGSGAVVFGLIALAVSKGRPGLAALIAASAVLGSIVLITVVGILFAVMSSPSRSVAGIETNVWQAGAPPHGSQVFYEHGSPNVQVLGEGTSQMHYPIDQLPQQAMNTSSSLRWNISLVPMLFLIIGGVSLLALVAKRSFGHAAGAHGRIWPAFVALPILAIFFFGSVRHQTSWSSQQAAHNYEIAQQRERNQQISIAHQLQAAAKTLQSQIEHMDIHELMDKFDAPRIVLQTPVGPTAAPVVFAIAAASQGEAQPAELPEVQVKPKSTPKASVKRSAKPVAEQPHKTEQPNKAAAEQVEVVAETTTAPVEVASVDKKSRTAPAWVDDPPKRTGNVRRELITTDDYATEDECYQAADVHLLIKTYNHVRELQGLPYQEGRLPSVSFENGMILADGVPFATGRQNPQWIDARASYLNALGVGLDYIRREIVAKDPKDNESCEYLETVDRSVGPMKKLYMQMAFTPGIDHDLMQNLEAYARKGRIGMVGMSAASVLALLTMVWGLLKVDTATKGYYSKWLFIGVPLAIIGGVSLLAVVTTVS